MITWLRRLWNSIMFPTSMDPECLDVLRFQRKLGLDAPDGPIHLTTAKLIERLNFMREELNELEDAVDTQNLADQADALIDLVYFAKGTAVQLGLPWEELWADVHRANMAKRPAATARSPHDAIKPPGWHGPRTLAILEAYGYDRTRFTDQFGLIDERKLTC